MRGFIVTTVHDSAARGRSVAARHSAPASAAVTKVDADFMLFPFIVVLPARVGKAFEPVSRAARNPPHDPRCCDAAMYIAVQHAFCQELEADLDPHFSTGAAAMLSSLVAVISFAAGLQANCSVSPSPAS